MTIIVLTLVDGEQVYTLSITIDKQGYVNTDHSSFDPTIIKNTQIVSIDPKLLEGFRKV